MKYWVYLQFNHLLESITNFFDFLNFIVWEYTFGNLDVIGIPKVCDDGNLCTTGVVLIPLISLHFIFSHTLFSLVPSFSHHILSSFWFICEKDGLIF